MNFTHVRRPLAALVLGLALLSPVLAQTVLALPSPSAPSADLRSALSVAPGELLQVEGLPLGTGGAEVVNAELRRTAAGAMAPLMVVHTGNGTTQTRPAARSHFTGQLAGDPGSSVFMSIDSDGAMRSIVRRGEETFVSDMPAANHFGALGAGGTASAASRSGQALRSRLVDAVKDAPDQPFSCGVDDAFIQKNHVPPSTDLLQNLEKNGTRAALQRAAAPGQQRRADIIIETDYELYRLLGSSNAVYGYVTDLLGYVSSQYESEIGTRLHVTQVNVYTSPGDPWSATDSGDLLDQLEAHWNSPGRSNQPRHHVHLLSARNAGGGVAYVNTLSAAANHKAYGVSGNISGGFSASNPQIVYDAVVVAHEIGHAFGSAHTHSFDDPYVGSSQGGAIDCCYSDARGRQCTAQLGGKFRDGMLPGINSISGGTPGTGAGTIMSYCDGLNGGMRNLSFNFGTNHSRGVNPWRVASVLQGSAQTYLPLDNVVQDFALSVSRLGSGSGSVRSNPAGIDCATSSCSALFAAGTQVTLAAQPAAGSSFSGWGGACSGAASSCTVNMGGARSVTANFSAALVARLVTLTKTGTGSGSITSAPGGLNCLTNCGTASATFASTTTVTLTAQAAAGSIFAGWSGACSGTSSSCSVAAGTGSVNVGANFIPAASPTRSVVLTKSGTGTGSVTSSPSGLSCLANCSFALADLSSSASITLVAQATTGSVFAGWSGACSGTGSSCRISAGTNKADVGARFTANGGGGGGSLADPAVFVAQQYMDFFRRTPDRPGLDYWVQQMASGAATRAQVVAALLGSPDYQGRLAPIVRLYTAYFKRLPDYAGLMYWFNTMHPASGSSGLGLSQVSNAFAQSSEFTTTYGPLNNARFVTRVYENVLNRAPEPAGQAYWVGRLDTGMSRGELMIGFSESAENQSATASTQLDTLVYTAMLKRVPSPAEHSRWLTDIQTGQANALSLIGNTLQSPEYAARF